MRYLLNKRKGTKLCAVESGATTARMPPPQPESPQPYAITQSETLLIERWIAEGALDN